jgi:uncharacterized protein YndB with AHSA1/START domain
VIALVIAGERQLSGRTSHWVVIAATPEQVYEHLVEVPLLTEWTEIEDVGVEPGPDLAAGSLLRVVLTGADGKPVVLDGEVTAADASRRLALILRFGDEGTAGFTQLLQYRLEEVGAGTRVVATGDAQYRGAALRLFEPLITANAQRQLEKNLARLKAFVEEHAASSGASERPPPVG